MASIRNQRLSILADVRRYRDGITINKSSAKLSTDGYVQVKIATRGRRLWTREVGTQCE